MLDFITRMVKELDDLKGKVKRAEKALGSDVLDEKEKEMLAKQVQFMQGYVSTLQARLDYDLEKHGR